MPYLNLTCRTCLYADLHKFVSNLQVLQVRKWKKHIFKVLFDSRYDRFWTWDSSERNLLNSTNTHLLERRSRGQRAVSPFMCALRSHGRLIFHRSISTVDSSKSHHVGNSGLTWWRRTACLTPVLTNLREKRTVACTSRSSSKIRYCCKWYLQRIPPRRRRLAKLRACLAQEAWIRGGTLDWPDNLRDLSVEHHEWALSFGESTVTPAAAGTSSTASGHNGERKAFQYLLPTILRGCQPNRFCRGDVWLLLGNSQHIPSENKCEVDANANGI